MTITTSQMLDRLAVLMTAAPTTTADYKVDCAIRRTLEAVERWRQRAGVLMTWSNGIVFSIKGPDGKILETENMLMEVRDFDPGAEE